MGLREQLEQEATLDRQTISFTSDMSGVGYVNIGSVATLLTIESNEPCRVRLYDTSASRDNGAEIARSFDDYDVGQNISLVADISMSAAGTYALDPTPFSVSLNGNGDLYYRITDMGTPPTIQITRYLLEDTSVTLTVPNRRNLPNISANLGPGGISSGSISLDTIPRTYLLVSASVDAGAGKFARLRLYRISNSINNSSEKSRPFHVEPSASVSIVMDAIITGSEELYFSPKLIGANLQNMTNNLSNMVNNSALISGENEIYYILENVNTIGGVVNLSVNLHVFSIED